MPSITVTVTGLDNVDARLKALGDKLHDFTLALTGLGAKLILFYGETVFESSGTALGKRWTPLAASTKTEKSKYWEGRDILVRTGALQRGFYSDITPNSLFISNKVPYFPFHQLGTGLGANTSTASKLGALIRSAGSGRGRHLPARPMIGVNSRVEGFIKAAIQADVKTKIEMTNSL